VLRWLVNRDEAAKRPLRTVAATLLLGLIAGGLIGYFRFGDSVGWAIALGVGVALICGGLTWRTLRWRPIPRPALRGSLIRLALPWAALVGATIAGALSQSGSVFAITFAAGLLVTLVLRRFVPR
jgi:zinc transporter ZupT